MESSNDAGYNQRRVRLVPQGRYIISQGSNDDPNVQYMYPSQGYSTGTIGPSHPGSGQQQVLRIAPRVVYNLKASDDQRPSRRGSVDSGLATMYLSGRPGDGNSRVIRIGPSYQGETLDRGVRLVQSGQGYQNPATQVYRIGSAQGGGRVYTGPDGRQIYESYPSHGRQSSFGEGYSTGGYIPYTQSVTQAPDGRLVYDLTGSPAYRDAPDSPRVLSITPRHVRSSSGVSSPQTAHPNVRYYTSQQNQGSDSPRTVRYTVLKSEPHPLSSDWSHPVTNESYPYNRPANQEPDYNKINTLPHNYNISANQPIMYSTTSNQPSQGQIYYDGGDTARPFVQNSPAGIRLGDVGRTNSTEETYFIGGGPHGRRRVSVQMMGRRDSTPGMEGSGQSRPVFIAGYDERARRNTPPAEAAPQTRVIDTRNPQNMSAFDKAICDSIVQFLAQQRQPYHNPNAPWRKSAAPWYQSANQLSDNEGQGQNNQESERNLFNKCKFQFGSIGNFNRSESIEPSDTSGRKTPGAGNKTPGGGPVTVLFFNDFDDMVARMRELKEEAKEEKEVTERDGVNPPGEIPPGTQQGSTRAQVIQHDSDSGYGTMERPHNVTNTVVMATKQAEDKREILRKRIEAFNHNNLGLMITLAPDSDKFDGIIRVRMNLIRPVQMSAGTEDKQDSGSTKGGPGEKDKGTGENKDVTTTYLPKDASKVIHISSTTTTREVIKCLLAKFHIKDNPLKFALYENNLINNTNSTSSMRRLSDDEKPLDLCLSWADEGLENLKGHELILQENDTGEIMWEAFSLPELENFLQIIHQEEAAYIQELQSTYRLLKSHMKKRMIELKPAESTQQETQKEQQQVKLTA